MRFDTENKELFFSTERILSEEGSRLNSEHFREFQQYSVNHPGEWMRERMRDGNGEISKKSVAGMVLGAGIFIGIIATVLCIPVKRYDLIPWILAAVMTVTGIVYCFMPAGNDAKFFAESKTAQRIEGVISFIGAAGMVTVRLTASADNMPRFIFIVFLEACLVLFLGMLVNSIAVINAPKSIYREEVRAECIGYARSFETQNFGEGGAFLNPIYSPVFEYHYRGEKYQSVYDVFEYGTDGNIEVGTATSIKIDPDAPSRVMGNCKKQATTPLCVVACSFAACVVFLILLLV